MRPAEAEDVAHIPMHVHAVPLLTCDLTNCQSHRKSARQTHQPVLLLLSPCTLVTLQPVTQLYEKMPVLQKHLKDGLCVFVLLEPRSNICVFCFPSPDFEDLFDDDDIQ